MAAGDVAKSSSEPPLGTSSTDELSSGVALPQNRRAIVEADRTAPLRLIRRPTRFLVRDAVREDPRPLDEWHYGCTIRGATPKFIANRSYRRERDHAPFGPYR